MSLQSILEKLSLRLLINPDLLRRIAFPIALITISLGVTLVLIVAREALTGEGFLCHL